MDISPSRVLMLVRLVLSAMRCRLEVFVVDVNDLPLRLICALLIDLSVMLYSNHPCCEDIAKISISLLRLCFLSFPFLKLAPCEKRASTAPADAQTGQQQWAAVSPRAFI